MSVASKPLLSVEHRDEVVVVKLNRSEKRNALNDALIEQLGNFFASPPAETRAIILCGEGNHFCSGLDLREVIEEGPHQVLQGMRRSRSWHRVFDQIQFGEIPVVSVLKGGVIGGGLELAVATHVRVCEPSAFFQLPEGQRGIFLGGGGSVRIPRIIGAGRVVEMMLTGRVFDADEGYRLGLAHHLVPDGHGFAKALELAALIAANAEASNYAIINGVQRIGEMSPAEGLLAETMVATMTAVASGGHTRIQAFFDRRARKQAD